MDVPSMVQRSGDTLIIRSVVSGDQIYLDKETGKVIKPSALDRIDKFHPISLERTADAMEDDGNQIETKDEELPQCKIKRNYSCNSCTFFTQNPRYFLTHLRDVHGEKIVINECKLCLYASRHYQKLVRHMKMVHGSTEGIGDHIHARKRQLGRENRKRKSEDNMNALTFNSRIVIPPIKLEEPSQDEAPQNRLLKCSLCEFTTLYRAQLVEHEQDEHCKTKFFRCEKCSYVTHIKARFSKHVKYHSMPMIKCVTCDFRTPYKWNLDRHMKNHGGTGPFKCSACNFTADIKQSLTVHEMNHHVPPVGHAAGMSMARRKNKVGGTDLPDDFISENGDLDDPFNNNNNVDDFEEPVSKKFKYENDEQPTDLSQKSSPESLNQPKKAIRPVPNLIPIQHPANALNLSITQKELSTSRNSLKDLATLFFSEGKIPEILGLDKIEPPQLSPSSSNSSTSKRKNGTFFDKLKETLADDAAKNENLVCQCGYVSKCLSESIIHRNSCPNYEGDDKHSSVSPINLSINSGSTRCQYCRHRCKSSTDLAVHIQNCPDAGNCQNDSLDSMSDLNEKQEEDATENGYLEATEIKHPMENKIFVWNKMPEMNSNRMILMDQDSGNENEDEKRQISHNLENGYFGVETAPGYGEMTSEEEAANSSLKKVYKCPHCSFWASTASRFHVHIVGHLNKKPFECSFCAYRSNWRWDITKHIRLKTIRDPLHKSAKVLMNDETGRRNYTKYNKYITLMKVTEEDGDPKLLKSGEMTPNQEASLAFINEYNNAMQKGKNSGDSSGDCSCPNESNSQTSTIGSADPKNLMRIPFMASVIGMTSHISEQKVSTKRSPPPLIKPGDDLLTQNIDFKPDGSEKRTLYKCRKCSYKNPSRDLVLSHVKGHYQEAGIDLSQKQNLAGPLQVTVPPNIYMNNVLAAMCLSQQQQLSLTDKSGKPQSSYMSTRHISIAQPLVQSTCSAQQQQNPNIITTTSVVPLNLGVPVKAIEHGEMDEASSGVVTTTGSGVTGWRGPAPYRCGHCHQVSNWKHVIQRHCRLKHNGDIKIETLDRTSDKNSPKYLPLVTPFAYNNSNVLSTQTNNKNSLSIGFDAPNISTSNSGDQNKDNEEERDQTKCLSETSDIHKPQKQKCPTCPYISESKSQMNYHITLHKYKPDPFECEKCNYTCSKKQSLFSHTKSVHPESAIKESDIAIDLRSESSSEQEKSEQLVSFCQQCPARFLSRKELRLHIQLHGSEFAFNCKTCNFAAKQEPQLLTHALAHTTSYQDKTEQLCKKFKEDTEYPKANLIKKTIGQSQGFWVVEGNLIQAEDVEDSIQKNVIHAEDVEHDKNLKSTPANLSSTEQEQPRIGRCFICPFESSDSEELKTHVERHLSVSIKTEQYTCDHCDFSINEESQLKEHVKVHFQFLKNSKKIEFFTSLQDLELTRVKYESNDGNKNTETLFKRDNNSESRSSSSEDCPSQKIIVDINSGEVINRKPAASFS